MSSRVNRADLLEFLRHEEAKALESVLDCFGYKRPFEESAIEPAQPKEQVEKTREKELPPQKEKPVASESPPEVFYVVQGQKASSLLPSPTQSGQPDIPEWVESVNNEALTFERARERFSDEPPPHQPLVSWSRLWPLLRSIMSQQHTRKRPDIPKLVKQIAKGDQPRRIPQQQRQYWSSKVIILMDRPKRLDGLNQDYVQLQEQLEKQRGDTGLECWFVRDLATGSMLLGSERKTWYPPAPETPILILSDLGIYDRSGEATKQWLRFGMKLRQAGCQAFALVPVPIKYLSDELTQCFQCISWDRYGDLKPVTPTAAHSETVQNRINEDQIKTDQLLTLTSVTTDIEQDFIRSLRYHFTLGKPWHIGHELLVWNHELAEYGSNAVVLGAKAQGQYRDRLVSLLSHKPDLAIELYQHVREQLAHVFTLNYVDTLCFLGAMAGIKGDARLEQAERYLKQFILLTQQQEQKKGLLFNSQLLLNRQDAESLKEKPYYSSLWAITNHRTGNNASRPKWLNHQAANAFLSQSTPSMHVKLIQHGESFYLGGAKTLEEALSVEGFAFNPYVLAEIDTDQDLVVVEYDGETTDYHLKEAAFIKWPATGKSRVVHIGGQRLDIEALVKPEWAGGFTSGSNGFDKPAIQPTGEDEYGVYFDLKLPDEIVLPKIAKHHVEESGFDVVFSYGYADDSQVQKIGEALTHVGYKVKRDKEISIGTHISEVINDSSQGGKCIISFLTGTSVRSNWVLQELEDAYEAEKLILIGIDEPELRVELPQLRAFMYVNNWDELLDDKNFYGLCREINKYCRPDVPESLFHQRFRYIPPQTFKMGSPESEPSRQSNETQHDVTLTHGYWLADTTVTQSFWETVTGKNPSSFKGENRPVEQISWDDTQTFIEKLKQQYPLLDVRLPSEAEWECAARAGTTTAFSFGGKSDLNLEKVNYSGKWDGYDFDGETKEVKSLLANPAGLYEVHGNVFEWCQDWYGLYPNKSVIDPQGVSEGSGRRVIRGGSWFDVGRGCRSAFRLRLTPDDRYDRVGFRLALGHLSSGLEQAGSPPDKPRRGAADKQEGSQAAVPKLGFISKLFNRFKGES